MRREVNEFTDWLAGFFDGEGCVRVDISKDGRIESKNKSYIHSYQLTPMVSIQHTQVAGVFDAEGWVGVSIVERPDRGIGYRAEPSAMIDQTGSGGRLVGALEEWCHANNIKSSTYVNEMDGNRHDQFSLRIRNPTEVRSFLEAIESKLIVKYEQAQIMLDEILPIFEEGRHNTKRGLLEVVEAKEKMDSYKGGNRGKYTMEYFEDIWDVDQIRQKGLDEFSDSDYYRTSWNSAYHTDPDCKVIKQEPMPVPGEIVDEMELEPCGHCAEPSFDRTENNYNDLHKRLEQADPNSI
jgi:exonuclease VII small subunit